MQDYQLNTNLPSQRSPRQDLLLQLASLQRGQGGGAPTPIADPYDALVSRLTKDYTPVMSAGRLTSRSDDPLKAIASLQGDSDFASLPLEHQDRVLQVRGGAGALTMVRNFRALQLAKQQQKQRISLKDEEEAADAMHSPQRMIKGMFERGDLMVHPEKGLLHSLGKDSITGEQKWETAPPWLLGHAANEAPGLGYGEMPMNDAQRLGMQIRRANPQLGIEQIKKMVTDRLSGKAALGTAAAASPAPVPKSTFDPRRSALQGRESFMNALPGIIDTTEKVLPFVGASAANLGIGATNLMSGAINAYGGLMGDTEDAAPYYPYTSTQKVQDQMPDWLRKYGGAFPSP